MAKRKPFAVFGAEEVVRDVARDLSQTAMQFADEQDVFERSDKAVAIHDLELAVAEMTQAIAYYRKTVKDAS